MKNLKPLLLGVILGALITYLFCPRQADEEGDIKSMVKKDITVKDTISVAEATKLFNNWQKYNVTEVDSTLDVEGSRKKMTNFSWSLDVLSNYLDYAKAKSDSLGYTMTGVTVYMANYGENKNSKKRNRNTIFLVPTGNEGTSKASMLNLSLYRKLMVPPLNNTSGGENDYP